MPPLHAVAEVARPEPFGPTGDMGESDGTDLLPAGHEAFFRRLLSGIHEPTAPFGTQQASADVGVVGAQWALSADVVGRIQAQATRLGVAQANLFHAAWALALARLCDRDDVVFGVTDSPAVMERGLPNRAHGAGSAVLPLRIDVGKSSARELVQDANHRWAELARHADASPDLLQRCTMLPTGVALFSTVLDVRVDEPQGRPEGLQLVRVATPTRAHQAGWLTMAVEGRGQGVVLLAQGTSNGVAQRSCAYLACALDQLLSALADERAVSLGSLDVMPGEERRRLLDEWNAADAPAPASERGSRSNVAEQRVQRRPIETQSTATARAAASMCNDERAALGVLSGPAQETPTLSATAQGVQGLLEARAAAAPDAIALIEGGTLLSHAELHARANRLAHHLRTLGVGPDVRVAVCMERSADLVVALLAILKAGGAYVPLDPSYPVRRLAYFVADSAPSVLLTHPRVPAPVLAPLRECLGEGALVDLSDLMADAWHRGPSTPPDPKAVGLTSDHLAYVAYTSGSTGRPKGVANTIAGLANRLAWFADALLPEPPVTAMKTSIGFVDSLTEMLQTLVAGGRLVVFDSATAKDPRRFAQQVQQHGVSKLVVVPSLLMQLLEVDAEALASVRTLVCSGERLAPALARRVHAQLPGARLLNLYGSSEVNGDASFHDCSADPPGESDASPIGRPIANTRICVLDRRGRLVPIGATGELFVGGAGLARGYLGRDDLTAERFIDDPFVCGARLYKTGDLARWRDDGVLEFLGRIDHQVKVRGFRVELGEIETAIATHPQVDKVVVVLREDVAGDPRLVAYLVTAATADGGLVDEVRQHLRRSLPDFMLPAHFVLLDALPLTPSGKLDRLSLPLPDRAVRTADAELVAPRDELETSVWSLWRELLGGAPLGVLDNFFEVGGNSLLVVRLQTRLKQQFGRLVPLNALLQAPTVAGVADLLRGPSPGGESLLEIRPGHGGTPVFFVHDGFGETLVYRALAYLLSPEVPVYGLCPLAVEGKGWAHTRICEMAAHYVATLRAVRPHGPWVLAGLCSGGTIAFEMASQLQQQGAGECCVVLIDANEVSAQKRVGRFARAELRRHWGVLQDRVRVANSIAGARAWLCFAGRLIGLAGGPIRSRLSATRGRWRVKALQRCLDAGETPAPELQRLPFDVVCSVAESAHVAQGRLESEVLLVRATQGNGDAGDVPFAALFPDPLLGWANHVRGPLRTIDVPGGHYSMFQPPHVQALAGAIQSVIDSLPAPRAASQESAGPPRAFLSPARGGPGAARSWGCP
jgi:amino acid adenylation domain-containing protein